MEIVSTHAPIFTLWSLGDTLNGRLDIISEAQQPRSYERMRGLILASAAVSFLYSGSLLQSLSDSKCSQSCLKITGCHMNTRDCAQDVELAVQGYVCHLKFGALFYPTCFGFLIRTWREDSNHSNIILTTLTGIKCCAARQLLTQESPGIPLKPVSCIR